MVTHYALLPTADVAHALALEEWLLRHGKGELLLLWSGAPAVIIGKYQEVVCETDPAFLDEQGVGLFRRFSGGGTVYIDEGTLLFSYIGGREQLTFSDCSQDVLAFLAYIGVQAEADSRLSLFSKGKKISGVAQAVFKERMLFHGTLLIESDLTLLDKAVQPMSAERSPQVPSVRSEVDNIGGNLLEVREAWEGFLQSRGVELLSAREVKRLLAEEGVRQLHETRYSQEIWTMAR